MTPPEHPTLDELADLQAGLLEQGEATRVATHAASCRECTEALAALDEVADLLREETAQPLPMPPQVAASLDGALATAARERESGLPSLTERRTSSSSAAGRRGSTRRRGWQRLAAAAAAVVVLGSVGAAIINSDGSGDDSGSADQAVSQVESGGSRAEDNSADAPQPDKGTTPAATSSRDLGPGTLRTFAQQLAEGERAPRIVNGRCLRASAGVALNAGASAEVSWRGRPALVLLVPQPRRARVLTCEDDPQKLFSTAY